MHGRQDKGQVGGIKKKKEKKKEKEGYFEQAPFTSNLRYTYPLNPTTFRSCSQATGAASPGTGPFPLPRAP